MRRLIAAFLGACLLAATTVPVVSAANFPEQPGEHVNHACVTVLAVIGTAGQHQSGTAGAILEQLVVDACFGG